MDFVRTDEQIEKRERLLKAKKFVRSALRLPFGTPSEKFKSVRLKVIQDLQKSGYDDAEQIVDEMFPSLKPEEKAS